MTKEHALKDWKINAGTVAFVFKAEAERARNAIYCESTAGTLAYGQAVGTIQTLADELRADVKGCFVAMVLPNSHVFLSPILRPYLLVGSLPLSTMPIRRQLLQNCWMLR